MRKINLARITIIVAVMTLPVIAVLLYGRLDNRAVQAKARKNDELVRLAEQLPGQPLTRVLRDLGQPTAVSYDPASDGDARLRLTYTYEYSAAPWSRPYRAVLHVFVRISNNGAVDAAQPELIYYQH